MSVDVLLPMYNGGAFLTAQLDSILAQRDVSIRLFIRDDASGDNSLSIARQYANEHPNISVGHGPRLGVVGNVNALLQWSEEEGGGYFALADQDDVWYAEKLSLSLQAMRALEERCGQEKPLLVCADARCVDATGREICPSFLRQLGIPEGWGSQLPQALVMSTALGCTCVGNAALRRMAMPLPGADAIYMHDWLLLVAVCFGAVHCIRKPVLDYRQHQSNVLGAKAKVPLWHRLRQIKENSLRTQCQAQSFLDRFAHLMDSGQKHLVEAWAQMPLSPFGRRRWLCWREGFAKPGLLRSLLT